MASVKKKKKVKTKVTRKRSDLDLLNLKVSGKDRKRMNAMAKKYAGGNLSAWLRYAGSNFVPPKNVVIR